jgi:hypothetical protein
MCRATAGQHFEKRISQWYDLASPYKIKLFEIKKEKYITDKKQTEKVSKKLQEEQTKQTKYNRGVF